MDEHERTDLEQLAQALDPENRVEVYRVVVDANGNEVRRIYRGSFSAPPDRQYPSLDTVLTNIKKGGLSE